MTCTIFHGGIEDLERRFVVDIIEIPGQARSTRQAGNDDIDLSVERFGNGLDLLVVGCQTFSLSRARKICLCFFRATTPCS